jgi:hypothetical protein
VAVDNARDEGRGSYLSAASDAYIREQIVTMRVLLSRAESNIVSWRRQLGDALAEADRRWGSDG